MPAPNAAPEPTNPAMQHHLEQEALAQQQRLAMPLVDTSRIRIGETRAAEVAGGWEKQELSQEELSEAQEHGLDLSSLDVQISDVSSGIRANAIDYADRYIGEQTNRGGITGFFKKLWVNATRDVKRFRRIQEATSEIRESGNLYRAVGASTRGRQGIRQEGHMDRSAHDEAVSSVVGRMSRDLLRNGENNQVLATSRNSEDRDFSAEVSQLVRDFARGNIDEATLVERRDALLGQYGTQLRDRTSDRHRGYLHGSNIVEVARNVRKAVEHGLGIDALDKILDKRMDVRYGEAKMGLASEVRLEATDRLIDRINRDFPRPSFIAAEGVITTAAVVALVSAKYATRSLFARLAMPFVGGSAVGTIAAVRAGARITQERHSDLRRRAHGERGDRRFDSGAHELRSIDDAITDMGGITEYLAGDDADRFRNALVRVAAVEARDDIGNGLGTGGRKVELYQRGDIRGEEVKQTALMVNTAEAKVALRRALSALSDAELRSIAPGARRLDDGTVDLDSLLGRYTTAVRQQLIEGEGGTAARERAALAYRHKMMGIAFAFGFLGGEAAALAGQELAAHFQDSVQGIFEANTGQDRATYLASMFRGDKVTEHVTGAGAGATAAGLHAVSLGGHGTLMMPNGYHIEPMPGGSANHIQLLDGSNHPVVKDIGFTPDGHFDAATTQQFADHGIDVSKLTYEPLHTYSEYIETPVHNANEYLAGNPHNLEAVHISDWQTNGTDVPDGTELKIWWGGHNGVDADGNYVFSIHDMMRINPHVHDLVEQGKFRMGLSMDANTQFKGSFVFDVDKGGLIHVDPNSDAGHMLFQSYQDSNGVTHAQFIGHQAKALEVLGTTKDGVADYRCWATEIGSHKPNFTDITAGHYETSTGPYIGGTVGVAEAAQGTTPETLIPVPFLIPSLRRGLTPEAPAGGRQPEGTESEPPEIVTNVNQIPQPEMSPRLKERGTGPVPLLVPGEEFAYRRGKMTEQERTVADLELDHAPALQSLDDSTKAVVLLTITSDSTPDDIANTFKLLAQQPPEQLAQTRILVSHFWPQPANGPAGSVPEAEKAKTEAVERAIAQYAGVFQASLMTRAVPLPPQLLQAANDPVVYDQLMRSIEGGIIKRNVDLITTAADRAVTAGTRSPETDMLVVSLSSVTAGMNRNWLKAHIEGMLPEQYPPDADLNDGQIATYAASVGAWVSGGTVRKDVRLFEDYPSLGVLTDFNELVRMVAVKQGGTPRDFMFRGVGGPNDAFKLSVAAALGGVDTVQQMDVTRSIGMRAAGIRNRRAEAEATPAGTPVPQTARYIPGAQLTLSPKAYYQAIYGSQGQPSPEDLDDPTQFAAAVTRIEEGISRTATNFRAAQAAVDGALTLAFDSRPNRDDQNPISTPEGTPIAPAGERSGPALYTIQRDANGVATFQFTDQGRERLRQVLVEQQRGARIARQLHEARGDTGQSAFIPQQGVA